MKMLKVESKEDLQVGDLLFFQFKQNSTGGMKRVDCIDGNTMFLINALYESGNFAEKVFIPEYFEYRDIYKVVAE